MLSPRQETLSFSPTSIMSESVCLRPTSRKFAKENSTKDVQATNILSDLNLLEAIQRRVSAPAKCTRVTDLDLAAAVFGDNCAYAARSSVKSVADLHHGQPSGILKKQTGRRTDYIDMNGSRTLELQDFVRLPAYVPVRRASTSAAMKKSRFPEYQNWNYRIPDNTLGTDQNIIRAKDLIRLDGPDTRRIRSAPADFAHTIDNLSTESNIVSCSDNNLSYVTMSDGATSETSVTLPSKCLQLTDSKNCSPENKIDSGSSCFETALGSDTRIQSSVSVSSSNASDELYHSCRTNLSQTQDGKSPLKTHGLDVKAKMQRFLSKITLKKYLGSMDSPKVTSSMPNIHNEKHRCMQKEKLQSSSNKTLERRSHTRLNMLTTSQSFQEALDNPIKIPSLNTLTTPEEPSLSYSVEISDDNCKSFSTIYVQGTSDGSQNLTKNPVNDFPCNSSSKSKFTSVSINTVDEMVRNDINKNSYEEWYFTENHPDLNQEMKEQSKYVDVKQSSRPIENLVAIGYVPKKSFATKSQSGIFSVEDLIFEQRRECVKTKSESVLRVNSSLDTTTTTDPARRYLCFSSSSSNTSSNNLRNSKSSSSSSVSSPLQPVYNPNIPRCGRTLSPDTDTSCSPCLPPSRDTSMRTNTSIPGQQSDGVASQSLQNNSNVFVFTALERTSSTPMLECQNSLLMSPTFVNSSLEIELSTDAYNNLEEQPEGSPCAGVPDRPQLLQHLVRSRSLAFRSHPLLPLLHSLVWLEATLLHAPPEIKLELSPHPISLSDLLTDYCSKQPNIASSVTAVLPRGLLQSGVGEGRTPAGCPVSAPLPTLHQVMLEAVASTHYSIVDLMAEVRTGNVTTPNDPEYIRNSSSIHNPVGKVFESVQNSFSIHHIAQNGSENWRNSSAIHYQAITGHGSVQNHSKVHCPAQNFSERTPSPNSIHSLVQNNRTSVQNIGPVHCLVQNGPETVQNKFPVHCPVQKDAESVHKYSPAHYPEQNLPGSRPRLPSIHSPAQNGPEAVRSTLSITNSTQNVPNSFRSSSSIHHPHFAEPQIITVSRDMTPAPPRVELSTNRSSCSVFFQKLPSFV